MTKQWNLDHPERMRAAALRYYGKNKKKLNAQSNAYYHANKTKCAARHRVWQQANKGTQQAKRHLKTHGSDGVAEWFSQGGFCAICHRDLIRVKSQRRHFDHDHATGKARGWLCQNCNTALGKFGDSILMLVRATQYLKRRK